MNIVVNMPVSQREELAALIEAMERYAESYDCSSDLTDPLNEAKKLLSQDGPRDGRIRWYSGRELPPAEDGTEAREMIRLNAEDDEGNIPMYSAKCLVVTKDDNAQIDRYNYYHEEWEDSFGVKFWCLLSDVLATKPRMASLYAVVALEQFESLGVGPGDIFYGTIAHTRYEAERKLQNQYKPFVNMVKWEVVQFEARS